MERLWEPGSQCPVCGQNAVAVTDAPIEEEVSGECYQIDGITRNVCRACGEEFYRAGQMDEILRRAVTTARTSLGRLSADEIREMRFALGLTQADLEQQLGVSAGAVGRWERSEVLQGPTVDRLMRVIGAHPELMPELGYVAREGRGPYRTRRGS